MVDITENMETDLFPGLHCALCNNFLSVPPILTDMQGKNICGRCESDTSAGLLLHNVHYETLARQFQFPCRFYEEGCPLKGLFGENKKHEETCPYQTLKCKVKTCVWSGIPTDLIIHNEKNHRILTIGNDSTLRELSGGDGCFMLTTDGFYFLIEWSCCESKFKLKVKSLHLLNLDCDITFDYNLISGISKKTNISDTLKLNTSKTTVLQDFQGKVLFNSTSILFSIYAVLPMAVIKKKEEASKRITCPNCDCLMTPPILKCPYGHITCVDCTDSNYDECKVCDEDEVRFTRLRELEAIATSFLYKCKWKDCEEYFSCKEIQCHQQACPKRMYMCQDCPYWKGLLTQAVAHNSVCTSPDYVSPISVGTEITILGTELRTKNVDELGYELIAHKELFYIIFCPSDRGVEVRVCNNGPTSLFGWYCYEAVLQHSEDLNYPFTKTYKINNKCNNGFTCEVPIKDIDQFGECNGDKLYKVTIKIILLTGSNRIQSVAKYFRWFK